MDRGKKVGYSSVLRQRQYMKLLTADVINRFGDMVDGLTFQWLIFTLSGSAAWSAILVGVNWLPTILLQPVFGALAERLNKKRVMVLSDVIRGCIVLCFAAVYMSGALKPWHMLLFTTALSSVEAMRVPTGLAFTPDIVDMKCYSFASALSRTACTVMELAGSGIAGIIIAVCGAQTAMFIDAATFFISAALIFWIHPCECIRQSGTQKNKEESSVPALTKEKVGEAVRGRLDVLVGDLKTGFSYMKKERHILNLCVLGMILNAVLIPLSALNSPLIIGVLGCGSEMIGFVGIASSLGGIAGGIFYPWAGQRIRMHQSVLLGGMVIATGYAGYVLSPFISQCRGGIYILLFISSVLLCGGVSFIAAAVGTSLTMNTDSAYRARIGGIFNSMATMAIPIVSVIVSVLSVMFSVTFILMLSVVSCIIIFAVIAAKKISFEVEKNASQSVETD